MTGALLMDPALQLALRFAAALLFLAAAAHKLGNAEGFRQALAAYEMLPAAAVAPAAAALIAAEIAVGIACAVPATASAACLAGAAMLALYSVAVAFNLARGRRLIDCGCGGPGGRRPLSPGLVARNSALAGLLLLAALPAGTRTLVWLDALTTTCLLAVLVLLHAALDVALANAARLQALRAPA